MKMPLRQRPIKTHTIAPRKGIKAKPRNQHPKGTTKRTAYNPWAGK